MATQREIKTLSDPIIYLDGRRLKVLPNKTTGELPGEVSTRAVSAGAGSHHVVHGYNAEEAYCRVSFSLAHTKENQEIVLDLEARKLRVAPSTIKIVEDESALNYEDMVLQSKTELTFEAEGEIALEFAGRYAGL